MPCIVQCDDFNETMVRAVIEGFNTDMVKVLHIDHGHFSAVQHSDLWSMEDLPEGIRKHPALAIPCILDSINELMQSDGSVLCAVKKVPDNEWELRVLFKKKRDLDGVWVVEIIDEQHADISFA
ncbi:unnamed protein product [Gongylonema pulchrum]|uniref:Tudor domain-containing protein n=1 Tax=Gongylonema pulchrum TaxID=637853 RepID=A0A183DBD9_9BILA|nr:unnamed protein product [Gongylonema pulchrum]